MLRREFFKRKPPKTAGREEFGREFVREFLRSCGRCRKARYCGNGYSADGEVDCGCGAAVCGEEFRSARKPAFQEMILSGGGAKNSALVAMLAGELAPLGLRLRFSDEFGLPSAAKEAVAFAVLAHETWHRRASNVPSATGAKRAAVLGKISYP